MNESNFVKIAYGGSHKKAHLYWRNKMQVFLKYAVRINKHAKEEEKNTKFLGITYSLISFYNNVPRVFCIVKVILQKNIFLKVVFRYVFY